MDVLARLDEARRATNVLEHPFYQRWSAGELSAGELSCYAGEYRHAVTALAEASARGLTNREVAAALFLSPKTVEAHLSSIYRKLGVHSRAALGAYMAERAHDAGNT